MDTTARGDKKKLRACSPVWGGKQRARTPLSSTLPCPSQVKASWPRTAPASWERGVPWEVLSGAIANHLGASQEQHRGCASTAGRAWLAGHRAGMLLCPERGRAWDSWAWPVCVGMEGGEGGKLFGLA